MTRNLVSSTEKICNRTNVSLILHRLCLNYCHSNNSHGSIAIFFGGTDKISSHYEDKNVTVTIRMVLSQIFLVELTKCLVITKIKMSL